MTSVAIVPIADRLVVRPDDPESVTPGGIVLPDVAKEKPQRGTVLAVGPGRSLDNGDRIAMEVAEGDHVLFSKYAGTPIEIDEDELVILQESDVLAKLVRG